MSVTILCPRRSSYKVRNLLANCGYGTGTIVGTTKLAVEIEVSHSQMCPKKELQKFLREEVDSQTIKVL